MPGETFLTNIPKIYYRFSVDLGVPPPPQSSFTIFMVRVVKSRISLIFLDWPHLFLI